MISARVKDAGARELSPLAPRDWGEEAAYFADEKLAALPLPSTAMPLACSLAPPPR